MKVMTQDRDTQLEEAIEVSFSTFKDKEQESTGVRRRAHSQMVAETEDLLRMQRRINKKGL